MGFFFRYIPKYGVKFSIAVFFVMCEAAIDLLMPTIMAHIIDVGVAARDFSYILRYGALMLFITLLGAGCGTARNILSSQVSFGFGADLRLHRRRHRRMIKRAPQIPQDAFPEESRDIILPDNGDLRHECAHRLAPL